MMRVSRAGVVLSVVLLLSRVTVAAPPVYSPDPLPDLPIPGDPPDLLTDPFDPLPDLPDPLELPFPEEDPIDLPIPDLPLPPDPFDITDPFPDLPSLLPDPWDDLPDLPPFPPLLLETGRSRPAATTDAPPPEPAIQAAATNVLTKLMPFPMALPLRPVFLGQSAPRSGRTCDPTTATQLVVAESKNSRIAFLNTCPFQVTARVTVGTAPVAVAHTPDGQSIWVANSGSGNLSIVDSGSKTVVGTITLPMFNGGRPTPNNIVFLPDGSRAYVTNHDDAPGSVVFVIDVPNRQVLQTIPVGGYPGSIAVTPDGSQLWVPSRAASNITVIDTMTNATVIRLLIDYPTGIAFDPTGSTAYVAAALLNGPGYIGVFDTVTYGMTAKIGVGVLPHVVKVTPTGHYVFVTNGLSNSISMISTASQNVMRTIALPGNLQHPLGLAFIR